MVFFHQFLVLIDHLKQRIICISKFLHCLFAEFAAHILFIHLVNIQICRGFCGTWIIAAKTQIIVPWKEHGFSVFIHIQSEILLGYEHVIILHQETVGGKILNHFLYVHDLL